MEQSQAKEGQRGKMDELLKSKRDLIEIRLFKKSLYFKSLE